MMSKYVIICLKIAAMIVCIACAVIYIQKAGRERYTYLVAVGKEYSDITNVYFYSYIMFLIFMVADKGKKWELVLYKIFIVLAGLALLYRYVDIGFNSPGNTINFL